MTGRIISGDRELSAENLAVRAARAATGFASLGIGAGDAVALLLRNDLAFFEASRGAALIGAYAVPMNWHLKGAEIAYILSDCGARVLVVHADLLLPVRASLSHVPKLLVVATPPEVADAYGVDSIARQPPAGCTVWDEWLDGLAPSRLPQADASSVMLYTSGTTGQPKGVRRFPIPPDRAEESRLTSNLVFGFSADARSLIAGPLYHAAPNFYGLGMVWAGAEVHLAARFDPESLLAAIERHRLTHLFLVPIMFVRLLALPEPVRRRYDVSSLRHISHAAAPCPIDIKHRMLEWWGPVITEFYGSTETGSLTFSTAEDWLSHQGTVGRALPSVTLRILDDAGRTLGPGEIGEVFGCKTAFHEFTYHGQPDKRAAVEQDGLITSGDIGYLDEDGFLFLCDRRHDMIISGGVNIYPAEIESCLLTLPGVRDCAVFGIPDDEFGEAVAAVVQLEPDAVLAVSTVKEHVRAHLAGYKTPKLVEFADDLPREDSGKVFKRRLRAPFWANAARVI